MRSSFLLLVALAACGSSNNKSGADAGSASPITCNGGTCTCATLATCEINQENCGSADALDCTSQSGCIGACGPNATVSCDADSTCTLTLGVGDTLDCAAGADCQIACLGACTVTCASGASCQLTCSGGGSATTVGPSETCS